jgi:uncharacterized protein (TIGR00369 family)
MHKILRLYNSINNYGTINNLDLEIIADGHIRYTMPVKQEHLATPIAIHGGVMAAFMDALLGVAALSASCHEGKLVSTIEFKINYFAPARPGDVLVGEGKVIQKGNRIIVAEADVKVQGADHQVAKGLGTFSAYPIEKSGILTHLTPEQKANWEGE